MLGTKCLIILATPLMLTFVRLSNSSGDISQMGFGKFIIAALFIRRSGAPIFSIISLENDFTALSQDTSHCTIWCFSPIIFAISSTFAFVFPIPATNQPRLANSMDISFPSPLVEPEITKLLSVFCEFLMLLIYLIVSFPKSCINSL